MPTIMRQYRDFSNPVTLGSEETTTTASYLVIDCGNEGCFPALQGRPGASHGKGAI